MTNALHPIYRQIIGQWRRDRSRTELKRLSGRFLSLSLDIDRLLAFDSRRLLGAWLESAKAKASSGAEEALYEFNARNQVTKFG